MVAKQTTTPPAERQQKLEQIFAAAYLERDLYHHEQELQIHWPENLPVAAEIAIRLQTPGGRIYGELQPFLARPGAVANLGKVYRVPDGAYHVVLMPRLEEYYEQGLKIQRRIGLQIANGAYSGTPAGTEAQRRQQALDDAARRNRGLFSEIAQMTLERWAQVKPPVIEEAITALSQEAANSVNLLGLLGMVARFGDDPHFPANLLPQIEATVLQVNFSHPTVIKSDQILLPASEILAGQLYPDQVFVGSSQNGAWHRAHGETQFFTWLGQQTQSGLSIAHSADELEPIVLVLTHLIDWAADDSVAELAAVLLDKLFFRLAVNSYHGTFGFSGSAGRTAATTSLGRLLWGMGAWNNQIVGTVSLAGSGYELPPILAQIAADQPESLWGREQHGGVDQAIYKTPDYLLCSVQDYQLGEVDHQQPMWQATFGPDAVVFSNQAGRVAQWQDVLVAHHKLSADDAPGFTYFPTRAFDEYILRDGWVFARQGDGYLALRASGEMQLITTGERAGRALRVAGAEQTWFLHLGRAAQDGSFAAFQASILALAIKVEPLVLSATTLRGETVDFGWVGPLRVNGAEQPLAGFQPFDNPYCVAERGIKQIEIRLGDEVLRLDFSLPPSPS